MAKKSQIFRDQCFSHSFDYVNEEFEKKKWKTLLSWVLSWHLLRPRVLCSDFGLIMMLFENPSS